MLREDNELRPGSGYEIARGDEMTCWSQLEPGDESIHQSAEITLDDAHGASAADVMWQLTTIHPKDFVSGWSSRC
ncbi:MAG: hypothetical protein MZV65_48820 [Chromatiales bacterium]|nr:hypothetical protein [Chromatiales bacterium]